MTTEEYSLALRNLEIHYQDFLRDSQDSHNFHPDDRMNIEREYSSCTQKYDLLLRTLEKGKRLQSVFIHAESMRLICVCDMSVCDPYR